MLEYIAVLLIGFWLGVAIFLYVSCYWLEEIFDLPQHSSKTGGSGASSAHAQLKRLVARVVEEAAALPALARYAAEPHIPPETATYEDLLASAILNKVIERYQTENGSGGRSSGIHSASASPSPSDRSSPRSLNPRNIRDITPPLHEEEDVSDWEEGTTEDVLEVPRRVPFPEFGGDIVHQTDNDFRDFDEVSSSDIQAVDGSWEENWLFQKKKLKSIQSVPVPMLVPNSNTEYKALIGDRDADDTTDLSDNASDNEEQGIEYKSDAKKVIDSKHVIGGKQKFEETFDYDNVEPDSLTSINESEGLKSLKYKEFIKHDDMYDSIEHDAGKDLYNENLDIISNNDNSILVMGVNCGPMHKAEFNLKEEIHRTMLNGQIDEYPMDITTKQDIDETNGYNSTINRNGGTGTLRSRHEREGEYEETVTVPVQRYADSLRRKHFEVDSEGLSSLDHDEELIPGSIADRERKKWLNYVDMPNNPYSPEAIKKRLTAKSTSSLFDTITTNPDLNDNRPYEDYSRPCSNLETDSLNDIDDNRRLTTSSSVDNLARRHSRSESPRALKDVLSEEIPQYKRYGRDYYIKEAKSCSGARSSSRSAPGNGPRAVSERPGAPARVPRAGAEVASPVSELEARSLRQNIARALLSPRNASPNFAINPIFEHPDRTNPIETHSTDESAESDVRYPNGGDGFVENEDIIRLEIPKKPQMTEDLFEPYASVRRSRRTEDHYRNDKPALNFAFGGSLRLSKSFNKDLW